MRHLTVFRRLTTSSSNRALCQRCYATSPRQAGKADHPSTPKLYRVNSSKKRRSENDADELVDPKHTGSAPAMPSELPRLSREDAAAAALRKAEVREAVLRRARRTAAHPETREQKMQREKSAYDRKYKALSSRWVKAIVALPILLVTSYYLFDRLVLGHPAKELPTHIKKERARRQLETQRDA